MFRVFGSGMMMSRVKESPTGLPCDRRTCMPAVPRLLTVASSVCSDDAAPDPMLDMGGAGGGLGKRPRAWGQVVCVCVAKTDFRRELRRFIA
jgi:hypothetical protein